MHRNKQISKWRMTVRKYCNAHKNKSIALIVRKLTSNFNFIILESVIKRRLLIDGDGTGDDRRLNVLLKSFIKWSNTKDTAENT